MAHVPYLICLFMGIKFSFPLFTYRIPLFSIHFLLNYSAPHTGTTVIWHAFSIAIPRFNFPSVFAILLNGSHFITFVFLFAFQGNTFLGSFPDLHHGVQLADHG